MKPNKYMLNENKKFIESHNGDKYYSIDTKFINEFNKYNKICTYATCFGLVCFISFFLTLILVAVFEKCLLGIIISSIIGGSIFIVCLIVTVICFSKTNYSIYSKFESSKEYRDQQRYYTKLHKLEHEKHLKEHSTDLVESYEILDSKNLFKEEKIKLLMKYIDKSEKRK